MKVWTTQAPIDEDFNRFENSIVNINDKPFSFLGLPSIEAFKSDTIEPESSAVNIESVRFSDKLKGITFYSKNYTVPYTMSAATENARRVTTTGALYTTPFLYNDSLSIIAQASGIQEITGNSNYTGYNICLESQGMGYAEEFPFCDFLITNLTTGYEVRIIYADDYPIPISTGYNRFYYNVGLGSIHIKNMLTAYPRTFNARPVTANLRRCRYPIAENDPIKVLNADYSAYEQRQTTEADFTSFKLS